MVDEYVKRLNEIVKRQNYIQASRAHKKGTDIEKDGGIQQNSIYKVQDIISGSRAIKDYSTMELAGTAHKLMSYNNPKLVFLGAQLYEKIGKANRPVVKNKLLKVIEKNPRVDLELREIEQFLQRNSSEKQSGLESKTLTAIFSGASVLIALFFLSPNITSNVIGVLAQGNTNIFGIILFVLGLLGLFISLKY